MGGSSYNLSYDVENRLVGLSGAVTATFVYDGDGNRVKGTVSGTTTAYLGEYFEWTGSTGTMRKFYFAGSMRVAMRTGSSTLRFLLGDHLGSTSVTTDSNGVWGSTILYYPWGGRRWSNGSIPTNYQYTDQRIESNLGLYFYNARWYDISTGRFIQADTMVPGDVQGLDRYAYVLNNPLKYIDPSGHDKASTDCGPDGIYCDSRGKLLSNSKIYDLLVEDGIMTLPDASAILNSSYNNEKRVNGVLNNYDAARKALFTKYGWGAFGKYMDYSGKLNDEVFMAMIIQGEFASESGNAYAEALVALSNQYYGNKSNPGPMQCGGPGKCTFDNQLLWATQMQAWYSPGFIDSVVNNNAWMTQYDAAKSAAAGFQNGTNNSWFWGDVSSDELANYNIVVSVYHDPPIYTGKPYFIVYSSVIYGNP